MDTPVIVMQDYKCDRCGYEYQKRQDYTPYLCKRCTQFIGKRTWTTVNQIQPPLSTPPTVKDI